MRVTLSHMFFRGGWGGGQSLAMGKVVVEGSPRSPGGPFGPENISVESNLGSVKRPPKTRRSVY